MLLSIVVFLLCALAIYFSCEFFVNGIEWVGRRLNFGDTATGTVLAAFGTALPESAVTFVAVIFGRNDSAKEIGVGAAVGGPLVLATISYAVVGLVLCLCQGKLQRQSGLLEVDSKRLSRDQAWFLVIFGGVLVLGLTDFDAKRGCGLALFAAYGLYVWREVNDDRQADQDAADIERLKLRSHDPDPSLFWAALQALGALIVIAVASRLFVGQLENIGAHLGMSSRLVALLLSPVATELPETLNAVIWVRQGRERLALANISGAMMIQATVPAGLGVLFTPWRFDQPLIMAVATTACAIGVLWTLFRRNEVRGRSLIPIGIFYVLFAMLLLATQYPTPPGR